MTEDNPRTTRKRAQSGAGRAASPASILSQAESRPWPLPDRPWLMSQSWQDLLFAHWPAPDAQVANLLPPGLRLDRFEGESWVTVVPFRMHDVRARFLPPLPWISSFPELNVRTYVVGDSALGPLPGVFFFSLDAGNPIAAALGRRLFHLPYFRARMAMRPASRQGRPDPDGERPRLIRFSSRRTHRGAAQADFLASYGPNGPVQRAAAGSLEQWLIERYCLYSVDRRGRVYRGDIQHLPWPLQPAEAEFERNWVAQAQRVLLPDTAPLLHFAKRLDVLAWELAGVEEGA